MPAVKNPDKKIIASTNGGVAKASSTFKPTNIQDLLECDMKGQTAALVSA